MFSTRKEKLTVYLALIAVLAAAAILVLSDDSEAAEVDGFVFSEPDAENNVTITGCTINTYETKVIIPSEVIIDGVFCKVTAIETGAFRSVFTDEYRIDGTIDGYKITDGVLFSDSGKTLLAYPVHKGGYSASKYTVPTMVTKVADYAFANSSKFYAYPVTIEFPTNTKDIGTYAFLNLNIDEVIFNSSSTTLGDYAFCGVLYSSSNSYSTSDPHYSAVFTSASATVTNVAKAMYYYDDGTYHGKPASSYLKNVNKFYVKNSALTFQELSEVTGADQEVNQLPTKAGDTFIAYPGLKFELIDADKRTVNFLGFINGCNPNCKLTTVSYGLDYTITKITMSENNTEYSNFVSELLIGKDVSIITISKMKDFGGLEKLTIEKGNTSYSSYKIYANGSNYQYNLTSADGSTLYYAFQVGAYSKTISKYTIPSTVTSINGSAFSADLDIGTFTIGYQITSVGSNAFGSMKFYQADGVTEITDLSLVPGAVYVKDDDGKYIMQAPKTAYFSISVDESMYAGDHYAMATGDVCTIQLYVSSGAEWWLNNAVVTSSDLTSIIVKSCIRGVITLEASEGVGSSTITAEITIDGKKYSSSVDIRVEDTLDIGATFTCDGLEYLVVGIGRVNVVNPDGTTIPKTVTDNDIVYDVVGATIDTYNHQTDVTKYSVEEGHEYLSTDEYGVLYDKYQTILYTYPNAAGSTVSYTVPGTVSKIETYAFQHCTLKDITIHSDVSSIGDYAFAFFTGTIYLLDPYASENYSPAVFANDSYASKYPYRYIYTYDSDMSVADKASGFTNVYFLKMPYKSGEEFKRNGMTMYYQGEGRMYLTGFTTGYSEFNTSAFTYGCDTYYIETISMDFNLDFSKTTKVVIGAGVKSIWGNTFLGFTGVTTLVVEDGNENFSNVNGMLVSKGDNGAVLLVTTGCKALSIPSNVTEIKDAAVRYGDKLESISFPAGLKTLGEKNFLKLTFKDSEGNVIEKTVENLAGCDFSLSETEPCVMILEDGVEKAVVTVTSSNAEYGNISVNGAAAVATATFKVPVGSTWSVVDGKIVFMYDGAVVKTVEAKTVTAPAHYSNKFMGWSAESGSVSGDVTITATFAQTVDTYKVTFSSSNSSYGTVDVVELTMEYGTTLTITDNVITLPSGKVTATPADPTEEYTYAFSKWSVGGVQKTGEVVVDRTMDFLANFVQKDREYSIKVISSDTKVGTVDGKSEKTFTAHYGDDITAEAMSLYIGDAVCVAAVNESPAHHTYSFVKWSVDSAKVEADMEITACFLDDVENFTVTLTSNVSDYGSFVVDGKEAASVSIPYDTKFVADDETGTLTFGNGVVVVATPKSASAHYSYRFGGWSDSEGKGITSGEVTGDMSVIGTFWRMPTKYLVEFTSNDGYLGQISYNGAVGSVIADQFYYGTTISVEGNTVTLVFDDALYVFTMLPEESKDPNVTNVFVKYDGIPGSVEGNVYISVIFEAKVTDITVDESKSATVKTSGSVVELDSSIVDKVKQGADTFTIDTAGAAVSFDKNAISKISAASLSVSEYSISEYPEQVKDAKRILDVDFGGNHDFSGGKVTISIPIALDSSDYVIGYVNGSDVTKIDATYDSDKQLLSFSVDHLSTFAVLPADHFPSEGGSSNAVVFVIVAVVIVAALAGAAVFLFKTGRIPVGKKN